MQAYSDPSREKEPYALPDIEIFHRARGEVWRDERTGEQCEEPSALDAFDGKAEPCGGGWYWRSCFPGCLPDSDANGPLATPEEALEDARSMNE